MKVIIGEHIVGAKAKIIPKNIGVFDWILYPYEDRSEIESSWETSTQNCKTMIIHKARIAHKLNHEKTQLLLSKRWKWTEVVE